ncbi:penicillin-binding protein [Saccharomonospora piscinae]|uniref:transglycosylase domain-containing protein n=1 Tax=Saccharomonospora piscinae TaxID=687388 RepID=UPI0011064C11|nr:transglycosylase domain-containing protein [Saccharomonospora piscinae]TLW93324.1 penicillin-binding protein [Saccharomonospora piscinae]
MNDQGSHQWPEEEPGDRRWPEQGQGGQSANPPWPSGDDRPRPPRSQERRPPRPPQQGQPGQPPRPGPPPAQPPGGRAPERGRPLPPPPASRGGQRPPQHPQPPQPPQPPPGRGQQPGQPGQPQPQRPGGGHGTPGGDRPARQRPAGAPGERPLPPGARRSQQPPGTPQGPARSASGAPPQGGRRPGGSPDGARPSGPPRRPGERPGGAAAAGAAAGGAAAAGRPGDPGDGADREPELITHRAYNGTADGRDQDGYDDYDDGENRHHEPGLDNGHGGDGGDGFDDGEPRPKKGKAALTPAQRKKRRWKIVRRSAYAIVGLFFVLPAIAFAITYFLVDVPDPEDVAQDQAKVVTYLYADGETEMGRDIPPDGGNRILLKPHEIPDDVKHAVYAAEDATFETNPGFDVTGILRAVYNQATGGVGGGSTITQQYVKVATENDEYSITRKWTEIVKAFKMSNEQSKDEIITAYLNTIYFGRGAYGIQTAAQAYYGKDATDLTASESALIAGMIQQPSRVNKPEVREERWNYVMDQMVANNWLPKAERDQATVPELIPDDEATPDTITGTERFIQAKVNAELAEKGYPEEKLRAGGYRVYLTIDQEAQSAAEQAVNNVMEGEPELLKEALTAVDPETGGVLAYYGGPYEADGNQYDWASAQRNPGSSYKPFDLVALLEQGKGLGEIYDGSSPRTFGDREVRNSEDTQCPQCTVAEAMKLSINTVFFDIVVNEVGPQAVAEAARAAGIPEKGSGVDAKETMPTMDGNISIGGGHTMVSTLHMANAYATFASGGIRHDVHFVAKLTTSDGEVVFDETSEVATEGEPAFAEDPERNKQIAGNVTESLEPVLEQSQLLCAGGRECAGKTGTHQFDDGSGMRVNENSEAWMVGYTPQVSAAVWVGSGENRPINNAAGGAIYGSGLPGEIWKLFMDTYLEGKPMLEFDEVELIGKPPAPPPTVPQDDASSSESSESTTTTPETTTPETSTPELPTEPSFPPGESDDPGNPGGPPDPSDGEDEDDDGWPPWNSGRGDGDTESTEEF